MRGCRERRGRRAPEEKEQNLRGSAGMAFVWTARKSLVLSWQKEKSRDLPGMYTDFPHDRAHGFGNDYGGLVVYRWNQNTEYEQ